jgi:hypothetical protein
LLSREGNAGDQRKQTFDFFLADSFTYSQEDGPIGNGVLSLPVRQKALDSISQVQLAHIGCYQAPSYLSPENGDLMLAIATDGRRYAIYFDLDLSPILGANLRLSTVPKIIKTFQVHKLDPKITTDREAVRAALTGNPSPECASMASDFADFSAPLAVATIAPQ